MVIGTAALLPKDDAGAPAFKAQKRLAIFGATGTIGDNTLDIVRQHPEHFKVEILTANQNAEKLIALAKEFQPSKVVIANDSLYQQIREALPAYIEVSAGEQALNDAATASYDCMVSAMVGFSALKPTLAAVKAGQTIAIANKECLVAAGALFMQACKEYGATLLPVDSEHNGLFQLWHGLQGQQPETVTLTASGGPFRNTSWEEMQHVTPAQAVAHPNWTMGAKISVDSATLMNKGLELIEAQHLFNITPDRLDVLVHPESIIHCLIAFADGSHLAQLSLPDMRTPLAYALHYPKRLPLELPKLSLSDIGRLHFAAPDMQRFPCLKLAYEAMQAGGAAPVMLNAANEIAVDAFLKKRMRFTDIPAMIDKTLQGMEAQRLSSLDEVIEIDHITREYTNKLLV